MWVFLLSCFDNFSTVDIVKEKWRHIRDYYIARRRKQLPSGSSAASAGRQLGRYGQILSFLDPVAQRGSYVNQVPFMPLFL